MKASLIAVSAGLLGSAVSFVLVGHAQSARTPSAVAYISATRVLTDSAHGRAEAARLQALQQQRAMDLRTKQQALESTRQDLAKTGVGSARLELQQKEAQQRTELERATQQAQADFQALQRQINTDLQQRLKAILDDLMKTQNYQLVVNSDTSLVWAAPELDLTSAVVTRMNSQK